MTKKIALLTDKNLPQGVKLSERHGRVSGHTVKPVEISEFEGAMVSLETAIMEDCEKKFPEANAIIGVKINEHTITGIAVTLEKDQTESFADTIGLETDY